MGGVTFTKTERAIMAVLLDGKPHLPDDLLRELPDELSGMSALHQHLSRIRIKLPNKRAILCQYMQRKKWFRLVETL